MGVSSINPIIDVTVTKTDMSTVGSSTRAIRSLESIKSVKTVPRQGEVSSDYSDQEISDAVKEINKKLALSEVGVEFAVDKDTDRMVVKVVDAKTKDVIRQIPNEDVLAISKSLDKLQQGLLIKEKA